MTETKAKPFRRAGAEDRVVLTGITTPSTRREYARFLRDQGVVFLPEEVEFRAFERLMGDDTQLRELVEGISDPYLVSEYILRRYPHLFVAIEQVLYVTVDWKIRRTKRRMKRGDDVEPRDSPGLPEDFYEKMSDEEIAMHVRRRLRIDVKKFNKDPKGYLAGIEKGISASTKPAERKILSRLQQLFRKLQKMRFPGFKEHIKGSKSPFPSMHVRIWLHQLMERGFALICGDVGTQKTSAAVVGVGLLGAERTVVFCPSLARLTWQNEIPEYFRLPQKTRVLEGVGDLREIEQLSRGELKEHRFLILGFGDLQTKNGERWVRALSNYSPTAVIIDEAHAVKHANSRTRRVLALARDRSVKHRIMLTATPFENAPNEVAFLATLLNPDEYPSHEHFTAYCRNNPRLFYGLMSKLMCEYFASEDVLDLPASNVDRFAPFPIEELSPGPELIAAHEMIRYDGDLSSTEQIMRMNQLLACPFLGKDWYRYSPDVNGLFRDPRKGVKLAWMRERIHERIRSGKIVVASGLYAAGVTREWDAAEEDPTSYVIAELLEGWFPGQVVRIDGSMNPSPTAEQSGSRREAIRRWKHDPKARVLVVSVPAASESVDLTLKRSPGLERCTVLVLTLPWKPTQYIQFLGRFRRPGMEVPTEVLIPIVRGTVDEAMLEMNRLKWRNFLIGMLGIPLLEEETEEIERRVMVGFLSTDSEWFADVLKRVRGAGEERNISFLGSRFHGKGVAEHFAKLYLEREEVSLSGDIARFCGQLYKPWIQEAGLRPQEILDAGCGPVVLERKLGEPVFGIDLNPAAIAAGRVNSYHGGRNAIEGKLSSMPDDWTDKFQLVHVGLSLHWSSRAQSGKRNERLQILSELVRVTREKGLIHFLLPDSCFSSEDVESWAVAVENMGLERIPDLTGRVDSSDFDENPRSFWSLCFRKTGQPKGDPSAEALAFSYERAEASSKIVRERRSRTPKPAPSEVKHQVFVITTTHGETSRPEGVARILGKKYLAVLDDRQERLVAEIVTRYRPANEFVAALRSALLRLRPSTLPDYRRIWREVFTREDAPRVKRATFRALVGRTI